jgi:two-component system sensor kinase FixL
MAEEGRARNRVHLLSALGASAVVTLVAMGLERVLEPAWGLRYLYLPFVPAMLVGARLGGLKGGLGATLMALAGSWIARPEAAPLNGGDALGALVFLLLGCGIAWGGRSLLTVQSQNANTVRTLGAREAHLQSILDTIPEAMIVIDAKGVVQ